MELSDFDVTPEEKERAASCTGILTWTREQLEDGYRDILSKAYCRSRHLENALAANERDKSLVYIAITALDKELAGRDWLRESRGSYEWDDDRWHAEFGDAVDAIVAATQPLRKIKGNLTNCPPAFKDAAVIRTLVDRNEFLESEHKKLCESHDSLADAYVTLLKAYTLLSNRKGK